MKLVCNAIIIFTLAFTTSSFARKNYPVDKRTAATPEEFARLNQRLNSNSQGIGRSFYFHDSGTPYNPTSIFNSDYCVSTPGDPNCYRGVGFQIPLYE